MYHINILHCIVPHYVYCSVRHYTALQHTTLHCTTLYILHHTILCCSRNTTLQINTLCILYYNTLCCTATNYNALYHAVLYCTVLYYTALWYTTLYCTTLCVLKRTILCCPLKNTLYPTTLCTAQYYNMLHCKKLYCIVRNYVYSTVLHYTVL